MASLSPSSYISKSKLREMTTAQLLHDLAYDRSHAEPIRQEIQLRYTRGDPLLQDLFNGNNKRTRNNDPPWDEREAALQSEGWSSDKKMAADFPEPIAVFRATYKEFWPDDGSQQKDQDEIGDFLESIEDIEDYEELTEKRKGLLGVIRREHLTWVRARNKRK